MNLSPYHSHIARPRALSSSVQLILFQLSSEAYAYLLTITPSPRGYHAAPSPQCLYLRFQFHCNSTRNKTTSNSTNNLLPPGTPIFISFTPPLPASVVVTEVTHRGSTSQQHPPAHSISLPSQLVYLQALVPISAHHSS
jgi:hypothetical protein